MIGIVLIDENKEDLSSLGRMIFEAFPGSEIFPFSNSTDGIQSAIARNPDLIFLSKDLPDMDGLEACQHLKNDPRVNVIPVVFLVKNYEKEWKKKALDAGADGFLTYPIDSAELIALVKAMSKIKRSTLGVEDKYRRIFENVQDIYYECSLDGVLSEVSPSIELITKGKYKREDFIGKTIKDLFINIKERDFLRTSLFEQGSVSDFEITVQLKDGEVIPCTVSSKIWLDEHGTPQKIIGSLRDITSRKKVEELLKQSEESYRNMFENNPQPMFIYDLESLYFVRVNNAAIQFYGYSEDEFLGMTVFDIRPAEDFVRFMHHNSKEKPQYNASGEWRHRKKSGEIITVAILSHALIFNNRPARYVLINDVSEHRKAEEKLQKSEEKFRAIFENNSAVKLLIHVASGQIVDANHAATDYYGWSTEELKTMKIQQINTLSIKDTKAEIQKIKTHDQYRFEFRHRHKDGSVTDVEVFSSKVRIDEKEYLHSIIHDISDRKKAEKALRDQEESYRSLFISNPHPMWVFNRKTLRFMAINNAAVKHYGYSAEEFYSMTIKDIRPEEEVERLMETLNDAQAESKKAGIWCHRKKNGQLIWVEIVSHIIDWFNEKAEIVLVNDVTERISIEHDLRVSEERFRKVVECSPNGIIIYQDEKFVYINPAGLKLFGVNNTDDLIGKEVISLAYPQSVDRIASTMKLVAQGQAVKPVEERFIRMDGIPFYAELMVFATTNNNKPAGQMIIRDITARKEAEEAVHKLSLAINQSQEIIFITDKEGIITFINTQFTKVYGYTEDEIIGKQTPRILKSEMISPQQYTKLWDSLLKKKRKYAEYINRCKDGRLINIEGSADPIMDENGDITGFLGIQRDISDRKKAEIKIAHSHELMRYVIEHNRSAIAIHDKELKYIYVSQRYLEDYHIKENIIGRHHYEVFPDLPQKWRDVHRKALAGGVFSGNDDPLIREDGTTDWTRWECRPWYGADGTVGGIIVYTEVINDLKKAETDLIAAKEKAEESDRLKSAFLANMSHEIRTPLNSIVGFSELLRDSYYNDQQKTEFVNLIIKNGQNLLAIINDILDLSKIQAGELKIKKIKMQVNRFLTDIVKEYDMKFQHTSVNFLFCPPDDMNDVSIFCDPERLSQVLNNLLSNAGKFTKQGTVKVSYLVKDGQVEFQVTDTGIGIAPEYHEKIFDRFRQIENAHSRKYGGNGLGLAISRKLIELMGGIIWVESRQGEGATFYFTLPLARNQ